MEKSGTLSNWFNWKSFALGAVSFFVLGVTDYLFFHDHPAGMALIEWCREPVMKFFDFALNSIGLSEFTRNPAFLTASGGDCLSGVNDFGVPICSL